MTADTHAEYRQLGKSGLRVSVPILGGMSFGSPQWGPWVLPEQESLGVLKAAWDLGITTIDTANTYSNGESEKIIGVFMKKYNVPRERLIIMTKVALLVGHEPSVLTMLDPTLPSKRDYVNQGGLSRAAIFNQVEASLKRLGTPYIDLLQVHVFDPSTPLEETMKALNDLVASGKVRYLGACNLRTWQLAEMNRVAEVNGWTQFVSSQVEYSLLYRTEEIEMLAYCKYKGIGILGYSPLMDGYLARTLGTDTPRSNSISGTPFEKRRRESDKTIIMRVQELADKRQWKMSQVPLSWVCSKITSPIIGMNSPERVKECIVAGMSLDAVEIAYLEEPYEVRLFRY